MVKKLTYREKLLELARIYNVHEIRDYIKNKKNLTSGQLELILKKNKIVIPKDFKSSFFKDNIIKPLSRASRKIDNFKEDTSKAVIRATRRISDFKTDIKEDSSRAVSKASRRIDNFKDDSSRGFSNFLARLWQSLGKIGLGFLEIFPKLGKIVYNFFINLLTDLFNGIYNQQKISSKKANGIIISLFIGFGILAIIISGITSLKEPGMFLEKNIVEKEKKIKKPELKKEVKKPELKKEVKKPEAKKKEKVAEVILPNLNLKTETVLNLFEDVNYDLNKVRFDKTVKPIYFTQFPKDLDEIQSVTLKKETFIKIVLPLIVAENEKILDDRYKLKKITSKRITSDEEKQWLRQKFLEYKVKKGSVDELKDRMDIIPVSIALAQAAKESGWGTSRFALEGNAIFGQWTWTGRGIEPLMKDKTKTHKILKFPILRASVKAYKNNLNTHKSYKKFRDKRRELRVKNRKISGLVLTKTLDSYAETGSEYTKTLVQIINQNRLMDFEPVKLANSVERKELNL